LFSRITIDYVVADVALHGAMVAATIVATVVATSALIGCRSAACCNHRRHEY